MIDFRKALSKISLTIKMPQLSFKNKLILSFAISIVIVSTLISAISLSIFSRNLLSKNTNYVNDITSQTVNNLEDRVRSLNEITFNVLSNQVIQKNIRLLNSNQLSVNNKQLAKHDIEKELDNHTLFNNSIESLSVYSTDGTEIVSRAVNLEPTKNLYTPEEIYDANGSAIWGLINDQNQEICVERAILDLVTQKPIGYIKLICKQNYIGDIMKDVTFSYVSGSYLIDNTGTIISTNKNGSIGDRLILPLHNQPDSPYITQLDGVPCYIFQGETIFNGWTFVTSIPQYEFAREYRWFLLLILLLDGIAIFVAITSVWLLLKRITSPLSQLCENMKLVGQGSFEKWELIDTHDEIGMLSRSYNEMVENIETLIDQVYKLEISKRQSELEYLKMQINPHFLYNTLDTISWMARIEGKNEISEVTIALASLLRANLKQDEFISVAQEMKSVENYLLIQQFRFGNKFTLRLQIEKACKKFLIPSFILQPIVENAISHGLEPKQTPGKLLISIKEEDEMIKFVVADDGVGMKKEILSEILKDMNNDKTKSFIGLKNVNRRLRLYYGEISTLRVESDTEIGTRISFMVPIENDMSNVIRNNDFHKLRIPQ